MTQDSEIETSRRQVVEPIVIRDASMQRLGFPKYTLYFFKNISYI